MISGTVAAALTPLADDGARLDEAAVGPLVEWYAGQGLDGTLLAGTTGEGVLLSVPERRALLDRAVEAAPSDGFSVLVHVGAQTTGDTVELASHAAAAGAAGVAVIAPPYFALSDAEILAHLVAAADACAPLPFYVYEFRARSGYPVPVDVVTELGSRCSNLTGLKVSDSPFAEVSPYLGLGLDVFVGSEALIPDALAAGAVGTVSGLASAFGPEVAALVASPGDAGALARVVELRRALAATGRFQAAAKAVLAARGGPLPSAAVRAPLLPLGAEETAALVERLEGILAGAPAA